MNLSNYLPELFGTAILLLFLASTGFSRFFGYLEERGRQQIELAKIDALKAGVDEHKLVSVMGGRKSG